MRAQAIDRSHPPKPGPASHVTFPPFAVRTLGNGIPVYIVENHVQPFVSLQLVLRSGASSDGDLPGLANFTNSLLLSGAGKYDAEQLAEEIDFLGANLDAGAGRDETTVSLGVLTKYLPQALDLMADVVLRPTFPKAEVTRERKHAIAGLKQNQSDPAYLAAVQFRREIFEGTPYGTEIDGTEASLKKITREDCVRFHNENFTAGNAFFVVAGDAAPDEFVALLNARFGTWSGIKPPAPQFPAAAATRVPSRVVIVDRPGSVQSAIRVGTGSIARRSEEFIPFVTVNTLFGGYFNSRINKNLREVHGYTYGARSSLEALLNPGSFAVSAAVRTEVTDSAIAEILNELKSISSEQVSDDELTMVKNYIIGSQALQIETPGQVARFVRAIALYDLPHDYYQTFPEKTRALTREQLLEVARRRMSPDPMVIVIAGDAAAIKEKVARFGQVTVVDERGVTKNQTPGHATSKGRK
jgi:zinc protease